MAFSIIGIYNSSKAVWWPLTFTGQAMTNYQRWVIAHSSTYNDLPSAGSYQSVSYNFSITAVDGIAASSMTVSDDDTYRTNAHNAGVAGGNTASNGSDFLSLGNYVHPSANTIKINDITVPNGKIYLAGQPQANGGYNGTIVRGWVEVLSTSNLISLIPLTNGNSYTITGQSLLAGEGGVLFTEPFDYSNGTLTTQSSGVWNPFVNNGVNPIQVSSNKASLSFGPSNEADYAAINATLSSGQSFYQGADITFSSVPSNTASFIGMNVNTTNPPVLGLMITSSKFAYPTAAQSWASTISSLTTYRVIMKYTYSNGATAFWVNPANEGSTNIPGTTSANLPLNNAYMFPMSVSGTCTVDNIKIGLSFSDVL